MTETDALDGAITPAAAVAKLQALGITVSERTLRERARALGACRIIGKTMFLLPSDIQAILEAAKPTPRVRYDGSPAATISRWTDHDTDKLIERIQNQNKQRRKAAKKPRTKRTPQ